MKRSIPLVVGNWKLNPTTLNAAEKLASGVAKKHRKAAAPYVAIAPSAVHLINVQKKIAKSTVALSAQSASLYDGGAHTGEESVAQIKNAGAKFVIVGHSERRADGMTDAEVHTKLEKILSAKMTPIVCVGELKRDRDGKFFDHIAKQLRCLAKDLSPTQVKKVVIAYEPIWAIGTGKTATAADVKEMQLFIESTLTKLFDRNTARAVRLLYGGSVKPHNAKLLHEEGGMNGFLVGGASLKAADFISITKAVI